MGVCDRWPPNTSNLKWPCVFRLFTPVRIVLLYFWEYFTYIGNSMFAVELVMTKTGCTMFAKYLSQQFWHQITTLSLTYVYDFQTDGFIVVVIVKSFNHQTVIQRFNTDIYTYVMTVQQLEVPS